jgi:hypothetical protein
MVVMRCVHRLMLEISATRADGVHRVRYSHRCITIITTGVCPVYCSDIYVDRYCSYLAPGMPTRHFTIDVKC